VTALVACLWSATPTEAGIVTMGLQRSKMPVDVQEVLHTFERTRKLQASQMQDFLVEAGDGEDEDEATVEATETETETETETKTDTETTSAREEDDHNHDHDHDPNFDHQQNLNEFVSISEGITSGIQQDAVVVAQNTSNEGDEDGDKEDGHGHEDEEDEEDVPDFFEVNEEMEILDEDDKEDDNKRMVEVGVVSTTKTGPRGGREDSAPNIEPTEISFMIMMEEFRYSNDAESVEDIAIGTKFGFSGKIVTKAEELGVASGTCTVTSDIKKELSYCEIYHKIETDNFGGHGSVMVVGAADEVGGRFLVTGTGGSLASTSQGYAMVQFDPAGNPVLYVLLKLF